MKNIKSTYSYSCETDIFTELNLNLQLCYMVEDFMELIRTGVHEDRKAQVN